MTGRRRAPRWWRRGNWADRGAVGVGVGLIGLVVVWWRSAPPWAGRALPWAAAAGVVYLAVWAVLSLRAQALVARAERYVAVELEHRQRRTPPHPGGARWTR